MGDDIIQCNTSAKTGEGINEMFEKIAEKIVEIKLNTNY